MLWRLQGQGGVVEITGTGRCGGDYGDREVWWRLRGHGGVLKDLRGGEFGQGRDRGEVEVGKWRGGGIM